jgi:hypothetical protein
MKLVASTTPHMLSDLALKVLVNRIGTEFITSDAPMVLFNALFNQWCWNLEGA